MHKEGFLFLLLITIMGIMIWKAFEASNVEKLIISQETGGEHVYRSREQETDRDDERGIDNDDLNHE